MGELIIGREAAAFLQEMGDDALCGRLLGAIGRLADAPVGEWSDEPRLRRLPVAGYVILFFWEAGLHGQDVVTIEEIRPVDRED